MGPSSPLRADSDGIASPAGGAARPTVEEIYDSHAGFVVRNLRRLGVSDAALDDAVQDVFVVVHRRLGGFEGRSSIRTWLFSILALVAKDYHRASRRRAARFAPAPDSAIDGPAPGDGPLDALAKTEAVLTLHRLLAELDDDKRALFVMVELEELSVAEAAETIGVNINTAHARLRAARLRFEASLAKHKARGGAA